jgi:flagellar biogenesis protein FliO
MLMDYDFWFIQPSSTLNNYDQATGILFAALFVVGIVLWIVKRFVKHEIAKKLIGKLVLKDTIIGSSGLVWYGFRYENIPIFARRMWAGLTIIILIVWVIWLLKYVFFKFLREKREFDELQVRSKYLPANKKR